jgi:prophage DNA circulation protein
MLKVDAKEAASICERVLGFLLKQAPTRGRLGSDLRTAVGDFLVHAEVIIQADAAGPPIAEIFELALKTKMTLAQLQAVRAEAVAEEPVLLGAVLMKNSLIDFSLASEAQILADMDFASREDVDAMKQIMNDGFEAMEEIAADDMDQMTYQGLIKLHAAMIAYLVQTQRPLPRMLRFEFANVLSTLVMAHKLYWTASRADELRAENKVVHPAFAPRQGRALSQ